MVIGKDFVWGHHGKTAGTTTHALFKIINDGTLKIDDDGDGNKHLWFFLKLMTTHPDLPNNRILNIRRLPEWLNSYGHFQQEFSGIPYIWEELKQGYIRTRKGRTVHADQVILPWEPELVTDWIRVEYLKEDFITVMSKYMDITPEMRRKIHNTGNLNRSGGGDKSRQLFTPKEIKELYINCPRWAHYEEKVYGHIPI